MAQKITIDGVEYDLDSLSDNARAQVVNLQATDQELARALLGGDTANGPHGIRQRA